MNAVVPAASFRVCRDPMSDAAEILAPFDEQLPHEVAVRNKVEIIRYLISALYGSLDSFAIEHPVVASRRAEAGLLGDRGFAEPDTPVGGGGYHALAVSEQPEAAWSAARAPQPAQAQTGARGPADVHRAAELDYARQVAALLAGTSVPVQELLLLLSRRAATPELRTPSSFRAAYRTVTGRSLHDDLGAAVSSSRTRRRSPDGCGWTPPRSERTGRCNTSHGRTAPARPSPPKWSPTCVR